MGDNKAKGDKGDTKDKTKKKSKLMPSYMNFLIGGTSGMIAICFVQPMDLMKTRMQLMGRAAKDTNLIKVAKDILLTEGPLGFYTGLSAALFRQATYTTGRLGCFNMLFDTYKGMYHSAPPFSVKLALGTVAGGVGAFIGTPAEVALIRMTADGRLPPEKRRNYKDVFNALARIVREEGVTTLWRGAVATITRGRQLGSAGNIFAVLPYQAREMLLPRLGDNMFLHFCASMIAGFVTTTASLPVDIVKTRVQNAPKDKAVTQIAAFKNVINNEGAFALWNGFIPTLLKIGPHTVLTFIFLEQLNLLYFKFLA